MRSKKSTYLFNGRIKKRFTQTQAKRFIMENMKKIKSYKKLNEGSIKDINRLNIDRVLKYYTINSELEGFNQKEYESAIINISLSFEKNKFNVVLKFFAKITHDDEKNKERFRHIKKIFKPLGFDVEKQTHTTRTQSGGRASSYVRTSVGRAPTGRPSITKIIEYNISKRDIDQNELKNTINEINSMDLSII